MASSSSSVDPKPQNPTKSPPQNQPQYHQNKPSTPTPSPQLPYPVASSGRGFTPKTYRPQSTDQLANISNPGMTGVRNGPQFLNQGRPTFGANNNNNVTNSPQPGMGSFSMRPPPQQYAPRFLGGAGNGVGRGSTSPSIFNHNNKNASFQSQAAGNGYRDPRDGIRDDTVVMVNHRKVRLSDGASLYALCRSWVRNGLPKETQPQSAEGLKLLPRPLPANVANNRIPDKNANSNEEERKKEDASSVEGLSARELLQRHVKRAKRIRAQLRKERLQRIDRYKQRLALLLPSPDPFRNESAADN